MSKSQLLLRVQHQSPSTTQISTRNFEQDFDRVKDLIFGPILIINWRFLSPLQLCRIKLPQIPLLKSCFSPYNAKRSKLFAVLRHCLLWCPNAATLSPQCCGIGYSVNFLLFRMLRHPVMHAVASKLLTLFQKSQKSNFLLSVQNTSLCFFSSSNIPKLLKLTKIFNNWFFYGIFLKIH